MNPRIRVTIDELILDGFSKHEGVRIVEAIEREVRTRFADGGGDAALRSSRIDTVDAGEMRWNGPSGPVRVAHRVADSIAGGGRHE